MSAKHRLAHGAEFPYDAPDEWWGGNAESPPASVDKAHAAARGIIADLQDRRGIKRGFDDIDESTRVEIVESIAAIIREAFQEPPHA